MAIKKIDVNLWAIKVCVRVPGVVNPVTKREKFRGTKASAELRESELIMSLKSGSSLTISKQNDENPATFSVAVDLYMDNLRMRGRLSKYHAQRIEQIRSIFGDLAMDEVPGSLKLHREKWLMSCKNATVNRYTAVIKAVFNRLVALELAVKNPISTVKFPPLRETPRNRYLTEDEQKRLLVTIREHRPYIMPIVRYMMLVPCRSSEMCSAVREQYNRATNTVYVPTSKNGLPIHKPVPSEMVEYFTNIPRDCPYLFYKVRRDGTYQQITKQVLKRAWADCLHIAGIEDMRIHDLRHFAATEMYDRLKVPERVINDIAGWKTNMLTTYRHVNSLKSAQSIVF